MFDRNDPADLLALKNEVTLDPNTYGYVPENTNEGVLDIINLARPEIVIEKEKISSAAVRSATTYDAYNALSIDEQEWIRWMTGSNGFEEDNMFVTPDLRLNLAGAGSSSIWAVAQRDEMIAAMTAIIDREGTRAEELFGINSSISRDDWIAARDS